MLSHPALPLCCPCGGFVLYTCVRAAPLCSGGSFSCIGSHLCSLTGPCAHAQARFLSSFLMATAVLIVYIIGVATQPYTVSVGTVDRERFPV
jgi:hypothetical protein